MLKKMMAIAVAVLMTVTLAACKTGGAKTDTTKTDNLNGKAYTEQSFEGATATGLLTPAVNKAGELVTVTQQSSQSAVVTTYGTDGKKKGSVTTDVTDTVSLLALGPNDEVYLLAEPTGGLQTVHVLDATGKTTKKIELEGMKVTQQGNRTTRNSSGASASPEASASPSSTKAANGNGNNGNNGGFGGNFSANMRTRITAMQVASDGSVLVAAMNSGVLHFSDAGKNIGTLGSQSMISYLAMNENGQLLVYSAGGGMGQGGGSGATLKTYDTSSGKEAASVDVSGVSNIQSLFYDKTGKRLLYMTDEAIMVLGADGKAGSAIAKFSDFSLLNGSRSFTGFAVDGQGTVYLAAYNSDSASGSSGSTAAGGGFGGGFGGGAMMIAFGGSSSANEMIRLGLVDASSIKERKVITMAAINSSRILDQAISAFQIANPEYKIDLKVYNTQVQGFRGGANQFDVTSLVQSFNTDLMSGKGADIIVLDNLPYYKYVDKGLLVDLSQLMADKKLDTSKYYSNIFDACKINGKLYGVPMSFSYSVLTGKSSYMPSTNSPTIADFVAKAKALPTGITAFAKQDAMQIFNSYLRFSYADLVDTQNHKANFNSPEFIQMLKDFKDLIGTNTATDNNQDFRAMQLDGSVAYNIASMSNSMNLVIQRAIFGDDLKYTNVPTIGGTGSGAFTASLMIGINANSQNKDAAWQFLSTMLGDDIQGSGRLDGYPVLKSATATIIANMKSGESLNAGGRRMVMRIGDKEVEIKPMTDADYKSITDTLPTLNKLQSIDPNVQKVLTEELPNFFSGQTSAEDVANQIQNRVNTIINE